MIKKYASIFVFLCGIIRSTDLYFRKPLTGKISAITLITWEHLVNLVIILPLLYYYRDSFKKINLKDFVLLLMVGCLTSAMGILFFSQAFLYVNPALAVLMQKLQPIISLLLSVVILKETLGPSFIFWALVAIASSYFTSFGLAYPFTNEWKQILNGSVYALLAAFCWGSGTVWGKMLLKKFNQMFILACRFLFGSVFTLIISHLFADGLQLDLITDSNNYLLWQIVYMALISGFIATSFYYVGLKWVKASQASILELVFPVSSVIIMWIGFDEPLNRAQIISAIILFYSIYKITSGMHISTQEQA